MTCKQKTRLIFAWQNFLKKQRFVLPVFPRLKKKFVQNNNKKWVPINFKWIFTIKNKILRYFLRNEAAIGAIGWCYDGLVSKTLHPLVKTTSTNKGQINHGQMVRKLCILAMETENNSYQHHHTSLYKLQ